MQLVAYGAQIIYTGDHYNDQGQEINRKKKKIRFFYDKIKNRKKPAKEKQNVQIQPKPEYYEPGYIYESSLPKYKPTFSTDPGQMRKSIFKLKSSPSKRARINFGWRKVNYFNQFFLSKKNIRDEYIRKVLYSKIDIIKKIGLIESIVPTIKKHTQMIKQIDVTNHIIINEIKNTECPITLKQITNEYIQCDNCKICYDYEETINWFRANPYCSYCTLDISNFEEPHILQYNKLYKFLRAHS